MHGIDPPTLVIVVSVLALLLAVILATMRASFPRTVGGIGHWAASIPLFVSSSIFFSQQQTHPFLHVMVANGLLVLGMLCMNAGMLNFYGLANPRGRLIAAAAIAVMAALAWFTFVDPSFIARLALMSMVGTCLFGHLCWRPLHHGRRSMGGVITAVAFGLTTLSCLLRLLSVVVDADRPLELLDPGTLQMVYLASFNVSLLIGTVGFILMVNERLRDILEFSASHDALTGVLNRGAFFRRAHGEFELSRRQLRPISVALLDLDHFKGINDRYGHAVGDRVLQDFCRTVLGALRPVDTLGRYGGEEFVLLLPGMARGEAAAMLQRLHDVLRPAPGLPPYTASVGLATVAPPTGSLDELLNAADRALYLAKQNGRNRVEAWSGLAEHPDALMPGAPPPTAAS